VELDVLRALGALAVVVLHASAGELTAACAERHADFVFLIPNVAARFAVPAFIILSGMGLFASDRHESYLRFLQRRMSRLLPAYLAWSLIYVVAMPRQPARDLPQQVLGDLLTGDASYHLYFVPVVVRLYLLYPLVRYIALRVPWGTAACFLLSWAMIPLQPWLAKSSLGAMLDGALPLCWIGYFALGIKLAEHRLLQRQAQARGRVDASARASRLARALAPAISVAALTAMVAIARRVAEQSANAEVALGAAEPLIFPYAGSVALWVTNTTWRSAWLVRAMTFLSVHSYAIYLAHSLVLRLCAQGLAALDRQPSRLTAFLAIVALGVPLSIIAAMLSDRIEAFLRETAVRAWRSLPGGSAA
jgi:surface polysaccharide O-acyltransferase-like enzyme